MTAVDIQIADHIAVLTLDRPEAMNAFTDRTEHELIAAIDRTDADDDVRAVVLTGAGRAFCAGADLGEGDDAFERWRAAETAAPGAAYDVPGEDLPMRRDGGGRVALRLYSSTKPVIAAINGAAVGVGSTLLLACDLRLASTKAKFGFVFARRGIAAESCSSWFLPRIVGIETALEWMYTGRIFDAAEASERGMVRSVHEPEDLLPAAMELAREIADNAAPVSVALNRQLLWRMLGADHPMAAHELESLVINLRGADQDVREGIASFFEKRPPQFPQRVPRDLPDIWRTRPEPTFDPTALTTFHQS